MTAILSGEFVAAFWNKCDTQHIGSFSSGGIGGGGGGGGGGASFAMVGGLGKDRARVLYSRRFHQKRAATHVFFLLDGFSSLFCWANNSNIFKYSVGH